MHLKRISNWIESGGGPLVLMDDERCGRWGGSDRSFVSPSEYEQLCAVANGNTYCFIATEGEVPRIVAFVGDVLPLAVYRANSDEELFIVRWMTGESSEEFDADLAKLADGVTWRSDGEVSLRTWPAWIFDSAYRGDEIDAANSIRLDERGRFHIATAYHDEGDTTFVMHRLTRLRR